MENYRAFKFKVQSLIKAGWLNFKEDNLDVRNNPLPRYRGPSTNVIEEGGKQLRRMRVKDVKTPIADTFGEKCKFGMIEGTLNSNEGYNSQDFKQIL